MAGAQNAPLIQPKSEWGSMAVDSLKKKGRGGPLSPPRPFSIKKLKTSPGIHLYRFAHRANRPHLGLSLFRILELLYQAELAN